MPCKYETNAIRFPVRIEFESKPGGLPAPETRSEAPPEALRQPRPKTSRRVRPRGRSPGRHASSRETPSSPPRRRADERGLVGSPETTHAPHGSKPPRPSGSHPRNRAAKGPQRRSAKASIPGTPNERVTRPDGRPIRAFATRAKTRENHGLGRRLNQPSKMDWNDGRESARNHPHDAPERERPQTPGTGAPEGVKTPIRRHPFRTLQKARKRTGGNARFGRPKRR